MGSMGGCGWPMLGAGQSPRSLRRPVLLEVAFPLGSVPNGKSTIISSNLRQRCQTTALLVLYHRLFF